VLVIKRHDYGRDYAVSWGGSVEADESFEQAAVRELREESTMSGRAMCQLLDGEHNGARSPVLHDDRRRGDPTAFRT
jgi:8-oxo-dGTP pyrophosphatase MutT (NUDIX family)